MALDGKKRGDSPYSGKSHYVDENKWCKNVRFEVCHYVYENKAPRGFYLYVYETNRLDCKPRLAAGHAVRNNFGSSRH